MKSSGNHLFVAVPIPDSIKQHIHARCVQIAEQTAFKKWVHTADYHITLKFLGGVEQEVAEKVKSTIDKIVPSHSQFALEANGLNTFGRPASPRILWMGLEGDLSALDQLQADIDKAMEPLGFAREDRSYQPHITLAKNYMEKAVFDVKQIEKITYEQNLPLTWKVSEIVLYRTHIGAIPMYEALERFPISTCKRCVEESTFRGF
jgi:2'-5' RNA ligase